MTDELLGYRERFEPFICDASLLVNTALDQDKHVLFEGAQGTLLDIDFGTLSLRHEQQPHRRRAPAPAPASAPRASTT